MNQQDRLWEELKGAYYFEVCQALETIGYNSKQVELLREELTRKNN